MEGTLWMGNKAENTRPNDLAKKEEPQEICMWLSCQVSGLRLWVFITYLFWSATQKGVK